MAAQSAKLASWRLEGLTGYLLAIAVTFAVLYLRLSLTSWFGDRPILILFVLPIFFSAYVGGIGPGLAATLVAALGTSYFLIPPVHSFLVLRPVDAVQWLILILVGVLVSVLTSAHQWRLASESGDAGRTRATERKVQAGFGVALGCLLAIGIVSYTSVVRLRDDMEMTRHTEEVIASLWLLTATITDAESGQRGYVITGSEGYLEPYKAARQRIGEQLQQLRTLTADNPTRQQQLDRLEPLVAERMAVMANNVHLRDDVGFEAAQLSVASGKGRALQDRIRELVHQMEAAERQLLDPREIRSLEAGDWARQVIVGGSVLAFSLVALALVIIGREFAATQRAEDSLRAANDSLESRVRARTDELAQSHASIERSEARLGGILRSAMDAIISVDDSQRIIVFNTAAEIMLGCTEAEALGQPLERFIPSRFRAVHRRHLETFATAGLAARSMGRTGLLYALRVDGTEVPIEASISRVDVDGERFFTVVLRDISERLRAEEQLRRSEESLAITLHSIGDAVIATDAAGLVKRMNGSAQRLTGWSLEDALGSPLAEIFQIVNSETREAVADPVRKVLDTGQVIGLANHTVLVARDGTEYQIADSAAPIRDTAGQILGVVLVFSDVTERYQTEVALRESENRFRLLTESLPQLIWTCDADGNCDFLSRQWVEYTGVPAAEQLANDWRRQIHPDDWERVREAWSSTVAARTSLHIEFRIRRHDGVYRWFDTRAVALRDGSGNVLKWFGSNTDIDDRKATEALQLRTQKMEALGTLAGGIAHDFNNILLAITGNTRLAITDLPSAHPVQQSLAEIDKASGRAAELVRRILAFSRQQEPKREMVVLLPIIEEALTLLRSTLPAMIQLRADYARNIPEVVADSTQVYQVVMNLATNAAYAIGSRNGLIEIKLAAVDIDADGARTTPGLREGRYARMSVSDNGCGMDKATAERIFDPFFTTKPVGQGTGLGLSVVDGIMKAHEGAITVHSQPGKGTTFQLYFPAATGKIERRLPPGEDFPSARGEHILYVDDDEALVFLASRMLERLGYRVTGCTDPLRAIEQFRDGMGAFDAVVTDLSMPGLSGFELAREMLKLRPGMPIILTSGYVRPEDQDAAQNCGIQALILKPNTVDELGETLDRVLRSRRA